MALPPLPARFTIRSQLGQGGMSTVYLAEDSVVGGFVALKILLPHLRQDPLVVERFRREIAAVRRIPHPNIVAIYDLVETEEVLCLVLEHLSGTDLKRQIRRHGPLPIDRCVAITLQVLDGLIAAHEKGVIHRDIKPHNIMVGQDDQVKIADFGLARVDDLVGVTTHTMTLGTPEYLAPELLDGHGIDGRADLYGLGITLYEMVVGQLPFRAASPLELITCHQKAEMPDPRLVRSEVPPFLSQVIRRATEKQAEDRFSTAREMKEALLGQRRGALVTKTDAQNTQCRRCGALMIPPIPSCLECGHVPVQLHSLKRGGHRVYIPQLRSWFVPARALGDDLTFEQKHRLIEELREAGGFIAQASAQLDQRLRHLPVIVAEGLDEASANQLCHQLNQKEIPAKIGAHGALGNLQLVTLLPRFNTVVSGIFLIWLFGFPFWRITGSWPGAIMIIFFPIFGMIFSEVFRRKKPLAHFYGGKGALKAEDAITRRAVHLFQRLTSPRLRGLVRRLLSRGFALRQTLSQGGMAAMPEAISAAERLLEEVLGVAEQCAALEIKVSGETVAELYEHLQVIEERIAMAKNVEETDSLIEKKHRLRRQMARHDEVQQALTLRVSRLLEASAQMASLQSKALDLMPNDAPSVMALTSNLTNLEALLAAHREVEEVAPQEPKDRDMAE